jgi:hypothetical protein
VAEAEKEKHKGRSCIGTKKRRAALGRNFLGRIDSPTICRIFEHDWKKKGSFGQQKLPHLLTVQPTHR